MSKDFEFFNESDFADITGAMPVDWVRKSVVEVANRLLNERGILVYGYKNIEGGWLSGEKKADNDTHEALLICPRPIEPEVEECDHKEPVFIEADGLQKRIGFIVHETECPKCGKDLR